MHNYAQLCTIMHVHNPPPPVSVPATTLKTTHHRGSYVHKTKNSRFRQQSGIFSGKHSLFQLITCGLRKNLSSPAYGNTVATVVTLAVRENGSKIAYVSHSARCAPQKCGSMGSPC